ncbi:peptide-methionine (S)-S-oxide reductase MsrA [Rhizobium sp. YIM 134829]|uniref:peptide-methionine (S)-S-oxide reductase MsrA n=1 Tax=Rhizobium sp. YIM 134829 TaxID=3390453 RepID=UPI00397E5232
MMARPRLLLSSLVLGAGLVAAVLTMPLATAAERAVVIPPPAVDAKAEGGTAKAVFAGGCFWGVQGVFQHVAGVKNAVSGYAGGSRETASYETVSSGTTGHAESVEVTYDPAKVSYGQLLQVFFSVAHNPTELNYQGPDHGTQYRSEIFAVTPEQEKVARAYVAQLDKAGVFPEKVVTKVSGLRGFYPAEAYHQDFLTLNPTYPYIVYNDLPKIGNLKSLFQGLYAEKPALVSQARG